MLDELVEGDVVRISIYELREEGRVFFEEYTVTETGKISIPDVGIVYVAGRTENRAALPDDRIQRRPVAACATEETGKKAEPKRNRSNPYSL